MQCGPQEPSPQGPATDIVTCAVASKHLTQNAQDPSDAHIIKWWLNVNCFYTTQILKHLTHFTVVIILCACPLHDSLALCLWVIDRKMWREGKVNFQLISQIFY